MIDIIAPSGKILLLAIFTILTITILYAQSKSTNTKIKPPQLAPTFIIKDINGDTVSLAKYRGKKVLLSFYRNVGCPVCNLRFHELQEQADYFKSKGFILLAVYESTASNMKQYLTGGNPYAIMIPNPDLNIYELYTIERSGGKMMKGMFHGAMSKMQKGKKLFKTKINQDGNVNRISADFLIDEKGNVVNAYYGKFIGDHLPMDIIKEFLN